MPPTRPFLTAQWRDLLLLNFEVPASAVQPYAPTGTEIDLHDGRTYVSVVGFRFVDTRVWGMAVPRHRTFEEVNLRFYVCREAADGVRRGVVFVREIVPRLAVTAVARWLYGENYITLPMRTEGRVAGAALAAGDSLDYRWRTSRDGRTRWNRAAAKIAADFAPPRPGSLAEFIVEHYWGYVRRRDRTTGEYRVDHPPWNVAPASDIIWDCDLAATYPGPLSEYLRAQPASAIVADGSAVAVYRSAVVQEVALGRRVAARSRA